MLSEEDRRRIGAAVHAAEAGTAGEIVTIVTDRSDAYHDAALQYSVLVLFLALATYAAFPHFYLGLLARMGGGWMVEPGIGELLLWVWVGLALKFLGTRLILAWMPLRLALVPKATRRRRVRRRAIELFKVGTEKRTTGRTGILIYLSMGEHMAEIVADEAIHAAVPESEWGDTMAAMVHHVANGRVADGMIAAIERVGAILGTHLPRADSDVNELPDRVIEL